MKMNDKVLHLTATRFSLFASIRYCAGNYEHIRSLADRLLPNLVPVLSQDVPTFRLFLAFIRKGSLTRG